MMQEQPQIHHVHLAIQTPQQQILLVQDIGGEEGALEPLPVPEEFEPQLHELAIEVGAVDVLGAGAVVHEFADVLGEAAAEVEEGGGGVGAEAGDEGGVVGGEVDGEVEEEELPDARVGEDVPGFFALDGGKGWLMKG